MKSLLTFALVSVAGLTLATGPASAWCCRCHLHCHERCRAKITLAQPNAFSPWCPVSVKYHGRGCCGMGCCQQPCCQQPCSPPCCDNGGCGPMACGGGYGDGSCVGGQLPMVNPGMAPAAAGPPTFNAPQPTPAAAAGPMSSAAPMPSWGYQMPMGPVQPTAYYPTVPGYQGGAYPAGYYPATGMAGGQSANAAANAFAPQAGR